MDKNPESTKKRNSLIARRFKAGWTMGELSTEFGISRQRVKQLLDKRGVKAENGGRAVLRALNIKTKVASRERNVKRRWGITLEHWKHLRAMDQDFWKTPLGVYIRKRANVQRTSKRKWRLTFVDFLHLWEDSGKWDQRGRGDEFYGMSLIDPTKDWTRDNVVVKRLQDSVAIGIKVSLANRRNRNREPRLTAPQ